MSFPESLAAQVLRYDPKYKSAEIGIVERQPPAGQLYYTQHRTTDRFQLSVHNAGSPALGTGARSVTPPQARATAPTQGRTQPLTGTHTALPTLTPCSRLPPYPAPPLRQAAAGARSSGGRPARRHAEARTGADYHAYTLPPFEERPLGTRT